jgi:hypothetical protein
MIKKIPFYLNHGHRCAQVAMKSVLKYILPEKDFSYKYLDQITNHSSDKITFLSQIAAGFSKLGINFEYYVQPNWSKAALSDNFDNALRNYYRDKTENLLAKIDKTSLQDSVKCILGDKRVVETSEKPSLEKIEFNINDGKIPIALINYDTFVGRENKYSGHYLILTGFDKKNFIYHDTGPKGAGANKTVSKERFSKSWNLCFFDHDLIVV